MKLIPRFFSKTSEPKKTNYSMPALILAIRSFGSSTMDTQTFLERADAFRSFLSGSSDSKQPKDTRDRE